MESGRRNSGNRFVEFLKREKGLCPPINYSRSVSSSKTLIEHIDLYGELNDLGESTVYTLAFNSTGELLLSGSDDEQLTLWEWETKKLKSTFPTGHFGNLNQAKFLPFTDDRKIITSATDGQIRLIELLGNSLSDNKNLSEQQGYISCLAVEPGSPYVFYSCGANGSVKHYDLRSPSATNLFYCPLSEEHGSHMRMFSMVVDPMNPSHVALGGEDYFARVYDVRKCLENPSTKEGSPVSVFCPREYSQSRDDSMILSLAYSSTNELLVSYTDETIYLFQKNMGYPSVDFIRSYKEDSEYYPCDEQVYLGHRNLCTDTTKGVGFFGPKDEYILSGSDCGRIFIWEKKDCLLVRSMVGDCEIVNQVVPHPLIPILATSGTQSDVKIWGPSSNKPEIQFADSDESDSDDDIDNNSSIPLLSEVMWSRDL